MNKLFLNNLYNYKISKVFFNRIFNEMLRALNQNSSFEVSLNLINNEEMQILNQKFRNINKPTDVLSFSTYDDPLLKQISNHTILGEIYLSIPKAIEQANLYNHSFKREIAYLFCHVLLHILNYDHSSEESEKLMHTTIEKVLNQIEIIR